MRTNEDVIDKTCNYRTEAPSQKLRGQGHRPNMAHSGLYLTSTETSVGLSMAMWKLWWLAISSGGTELRSVIGGPLWDVLLQGQYGSGGDHDHHHGISQGE